MVMYVSQTMLKHSTGLKKKWSTASGVLWYLSHFLSTARANSREVRLPSWVQKKLLQAAKMTEPFLVKATCCLAYQVSKSCLLGWFSVNLLR